jgi:hypothetical protein
MKRYLLALLMGGFLLSGCAETLETVCLPPEEMVSQLQNKYGEAAIWIGQSETGYAVLYLSPTGTWSEVFFTEDIACLDRAGTGFDILNPGRAS